MDWVLPSDQPSPGVRGGSRGRTSAAPGPPALHRLQLPAGGVVSAPAATAASPSQRRGERRGPEGAAGTAGSGKSGRRGPTWKRRGPAVELPAAAAPATGASAVAGAESGHGGGTSPSGPRRPAPRERGNSRDASGFVSRDPSILAGPCWQSSCPGWRSLGFRRPGTRNSFYKLTDYPQNWPLELGTLTS